MKNKSMILARPMTTFSTRHGYHPKQSGIKIRQSAPDNLRWELVTAFYEAPVKAYGAQELRPSTLRAIACSTLRKRPDTRNWSEYPNIDDEVRQLIDQCEWYRVYDIIEAICSSLPMPEEIAFTNTLNEFFEEEGIGWQIKSGKVEYRDDDEFELLMQNTISTLNDVKKTTAKQELNEALLDLSRRPAPDATGAIQHAMAALECFMRETCEDKATLGNLLNRYNGLIPKPLDSSIEKAWGYASERGRHLMEGNTPSLEESELIVHLCCSIISYLDKKLKQVY